MIEQRNESHHPSEPKARCGKLLRRALLLLLTALAIGLAAGGYAVHTATLFLETPPETPGRDKVFVIEPGTSFVQVAEELEQENLVTDALFFRLLARYEQKDAGVQAGEFPLNTGLTPREVLAAITSGKRVLYKLSIPEGLTWRQTADIAAESGLADLSEFRKAVFDKDFLARHDVPGDSAEGFLYPETYFLTRPENAYDVVAALLDGFKRHARNKVYPNGAPEPEELRRLVILASLVEKETAVPAERERVAGVYANRLKRGMLLQCDPTVIYGLGEAFDGNLKRSHLNDRSNPYNTYRHKGLPPGPICSPGLASLLAAKNPEQHSYLYFVAKGDGSHAFSKNLTQHNRAVRKYQLRR